MAIMTETSPQPLDRPKGRRPFSALMKKLANLKAASTSDGGRHANAKRHAMKIASKKRNNNPYGQSTQAGATVPAPTSHYSLSTTRSGRSSSATSLDQEECVRLSTDGAPPTTGGRSMAQTISIADHETSRSITARSYGASSLAGTSRTANGGLESRRGGDSTFSSPAPSVRSLTTTLTTIQSMAANGGGNQNHHTSSHNHHQSHHLSNSQIIHFNQPFPTTSPASAIPAHLAPSGSTTGHPTTYATATANNLLTDNASILTLASSSKRRRRRSFDTDASVRALAPSSIFGGSRESLPLSVLSANFDGTGIGTGPATPGLHRGASGIANERTSIYSANGILAAASERNSFYAKQAMTDAASVRSGLLGHGRADSISGSIGGLATSPLASPRETMAEHRDVGANGVEERDEEDDPQTPDEG